jgi:hypothetical protein
LVKRIITDSNGRKHITNEPLLHTKRQWIGLDQTTKPDIRHQTEAFFAGVQWAETRLKELNT